MNRLFHLKETFLKNMMNNVQYGNLEILLLDYNSGDSMEQWVKTNFAAYIDKGIVKYYKTFEPAVFNHSHAKNLAFKLATGDVVCNINADNFVGPGFAAYLNDVLQENSSTFIRPEGFHPGVAGVICVNKQDFLDIGGFDEKMSVYGWEDVDFRNRLQMAGVKEWKLMNKKFLHAIDHEEKFDIRKLRSRIRAVYVNHLNPEAMTTRVLMLFEDNTYKYGTIVDNAKKSREHFEYQYDLEELYWITGSWQNAATTLILLDESSENIRYTLALANGTLSSNGVDTSHYQVIDEHMLNRIAYFEMDYNNRIVMINNTNAGRVVVNEGSFGQARVFRNFDYSNEIEVG